MSPIVAAAPAKQTSALSAAEDGIANLFRRLDLSEGEEETQIIADTLVRALGFTYFSYGLPWLASDWGRPNDIGMLLSTYPEDWQNLYRRRNYHSADAVILYGRHALRPFNWGDERHLRGLEPSARRIFFEAQDFGISSGIAIPVHGPRNMSGVFSVAGPEARQPEADIGQPALHALLAVAQMVHAHVVQWRTERRPQATVKLSEHERLCLLWTTQGKTSWEVAQIIGRSKATVDFHLRRAASKLDASNKVHAAFKARELNLL
ncbi:LuxR family transcriptional regulator [Mesorhizobium sp. BR1-1-16]|uniref:helix-turn-helix transcriptional regulator n=1 Tax=Mesorhizobium sp. BR1-1-16 TaxID=2876653 RepID=UPI001CCEBFAF|nr:LuxR family transcriptional regulator [Mesorhizobium sp. BR1-1-16]MBZ9939282.1 LuxR family transcriptional regulator [Mesorhizobium sp. BR1-1-16]